MSYLHNVIQDTYTPAPKSWVGFVAYKLSGVSSNILRTAEQTIVNDSDLVAVYF